MRGSLYPSGFERELANNLNFFRDGVGVDPFTKVPYDHIFVTNDKITNQARYTNTTEIGLYLSILIEVEKAGNEFALARIGEVLGVLETIRTPERACITGHTKCYMRAGYCPARNSSDTFAMGESVPVEDNANLAWALVGVAGAYIDSEQAAKKAIVARVQSLLERQIPGWTELYAAGRADT